MLVDESIVPYVTLFSLSCFRKKIGRNWAIAEYQFNTIYSFHNNFLGEYFKPLKKNNAKEILKKKWRKIPRNIKLNEPKTRNLRMLYYRN